MFLLGQTNDQPYICRQSLSFLTYKSSNSDFPLPIKRTH